MEQSLSWWMWMAFGSLLTALTLLWLFLIYFITKSDGEKQ